MASIDFHRSVEIVNFCSFIGLVLGLFCTWEKSAESYTVFSISFSANVALPEYNGGRWSIFRFLPVWRPSKNRLKDSLAVHIKEPNSQILHTPTDISRNFWTLFPLNLLILPGLEIRISILIPIALDRSTRVPLRNWRKVPTWFLCEIYPNRFLPVASSPTASAIKEQGWVGLDEFIRLSAKPTMAFTPSAASLGAWNSYNRYRIFCLATLNRTLIQNGKLFQR